MKPIIIGSDNGIELTIIGSDNGIELTIIGSDNGIELTIIGSDNGIELTIIGSDNGLSPTRRQSIIWTNAGILLIWPLGTDFGAILIEIHICSFKEMHFKMSSAKCWPFCLDLNVLIHCGQQNPYGNIYLGQH